MLNPRSTDDIHPVRLINDLTCTSCSASSCTLCGQAGSTVGLKTDDTCMPIPAPADMCLPQLRPLMSACKSQLNANAHASRIQRLLTHDSMPFEPHVGAVPFSALSGNSSPSATAGFEMLIVSC